MSKDPTDPKYQWSQNMLTGVNELNQTSTATVGTNEVNQEWQSPYRRPEFKAGDVVMLKSGGPAMTVYKRTNTGLVAVCWFDIAELYKEELRPEMLVSVAPPKPLESR